MGASRFSNSTAGISRLPECFPELLCVPVLIDTLFNTRSEPSCLYPDDAIKCFLGMDIDFRVIGPFLVSKVEM
jgi:carbamoyltransferase